MHLVLDVVVGREQAKDEDAGNLLRARVRQWFMRFGIRQQLLQACFDAGHDPGRLLNSRDLADRQATAVACCVIAPADNL